MEHGPFKLNGKRVLLRGTQRHADFAGEAAAMSDDQVREEMRLIREMGANFIRLAHYQQDRLVLDLCDELGLMVWEEVPWCRAGVGSEAFQQNAKDMLTHMIDQHYNHPSIILWGLGNEDDWPDEYPSVDQKAIRGFMTELRDLAHSLDNSRLTSFRRCDFARDIPDVYSPSIWAGWYSGNYREYEQSLITQRERVKRFIHIEWGADSQAGRHSEDPEAVLGKVATGQGTAEVGLAYLKTGGAVRVSKDGDWSETYACNLFDWHLKTQEKLDWLTGSAQWIFKDFPSPLRGDNAIPAHESKGRSRAGHDEEGVVLTSSSPTGPRSRWRTSTATPGQCAGAKPVRLAMCTCTPTAIAPSFFSTANRSAPCSATARTSPPRDCAGRSPLPAEPTASMSLPPRGRSR